MGFKPIMETPVLQKNLNDAPALVAALLKTFKLLNISARLYVER